ncbi:unnamed protein product [Protopolystoma xenopodis]|uniref:Uncharacterized protein n=1 Tax=Protopolystoma xenopodis TaxID=117903 RepID=A0A448XJ47_9PLAT|nr:unnamed protein product [Protopolystoma xenopodis]
MPFTIRPIDFLYVLGSDIESYQPISTSLPPLLSSDHPLVDCLRHTLALSATFDQSLATPVSDPYVLAILHDTWCPGLDLLLAWIQVPSPNSGSTDAILSANSRPTDGPASGVDIDHVDAAHRLASMLHDLWDQLFEPYISEQSMLQNKRVSTRLYSSQPQPQTQNPSLVSFPSSNLSDIQYQSSLNEAAFSASTTSAVYRQALDQPASWLIRLRTTAWLPVIRSLSCGIPKPILMPPYGPTLSMIEPQHSSEPVLCTTNMDTATRTASTDEPCHPQFGHVYAPSAFVSILFCPTMSHIGSTELTNQGDSLKSRTMVAPKRQALLSTSFGTPNSEGLQDVEPILPVLTNLAELMECACSFWSVGPYILRSPPYRSFMDALVSLSIYTS